MSGSWSGRSPTFALAPALTLVSVLFGTPAARADATAPLSPTSLASPVRLGRAPAKAAAAAAIEQAGETIVDLDASALSALRSASGPVTVSSFPIGVSLTAELDLEPFEVLSPGAVVLVHGPDGETVRGFERVAHFRGSIRGDPDSLVYVGAQANALVAILQTRAGIVSIGPETPTGPALHVLRTTRSWAHVETAARGWECAADELPMAPSTGRRAPAGLEVFSRAPLAVAAAGPGYKQAEISVETDEELLALLGNVPALTAYVTTVFAAMEVIYERDLLTKLHVNFLDVWTTADPWVSSDASTQLSEVGDWWHANRPLASNPRSLVHFLSGKSTGGGKAGIAWIGVACSGDFLQGGHWGGAYGVTQIYGDYPSGAWDVIGTAHEIGHNFGSPHTHCYSPPIDMCFSGETGCYSGPVSVPPGGGTLMSYCHFIGGLGVINLRFDLRCVNERMLPEIASSACLADVASPPAATAFYTLTPCRLFDSRNATGPSGGPALSANAGRALPGAGTCGIPSTAKAISAVVVSVLPGAQGDVRMFPTGTPSPATSAINFNPARVRANNAVLPLGAAGQISAFCDMPAGSTSSTHFVIDVYGYFQ